jgi:hypothetical protein
MKREKDDEEIVIEVEGKEIAIKSSKGVMAIIPKKDVEWVKKKIKEGCHECVDHYVNGLKRFDK